MLSDISQKIPAEPIEVRGIVLSVHPYSDKHLVLRLLLEHFGKVSALAQNARGSKKRFPTLDLFQRGSFRIVRGRGSLSQIQEFVPERALEQLRFNLTALAIASLLAEVTDQLCHEESEDDAGIFESFSTVLDSIAATKDPKEMLRLCYEALVGQLAQSGFLDPEQVERPSRNSLIRLMRHTEMVTERPLKSRKAVEEELARLK